MADPISDSLEAFDAQIGPETNVAAQLSPVSPDLVSGFTTPSSPEKVIVGTTTDPSPTVSIPDPSAASISVTEIVAPVTDPSCSVEVQAEPNIELSSVGIPHCSSVIVLEKEVALVETTTKSVVIDAAVIGSVEVAAVDVAAVIDNVEVAGSNLETVNSQETLAAGSAPIKAISAQLGTQEATGPSSEINMEKQAPTGKEKQAPAVPSKDPSDTWCAHARGKKLSKKGEAFTLPSGEACIKIPNSIIEKNRKAWEPFVLGQFYSDHPTQGTLHNIVNGIWSKQYRDIAVSKMEGFAFLFRIPNAATRDRVIKQRLWLIEGQTMFVDKWEPGVVPTKPELTSAPIWLELRKVPLQFFNEDGLERIAGLVGDPKYLHPTTANKTNLEVAKVFTIIDPRQPLPEAVNVQFDTGEISRVLVSSPWMPPVCSICKEIGHVDRRCPSLVKSCAGCKSNSHTLANCPQKQKNEPPKRKTRRSRSRGKKEWREVDHKEEVTPALPPAPPPGLAKEQHTEIVIHSKLGVLHDLERGETSATPEYLQFRKQGSNSGNSRTSKSDLPSDSSDVESSDSELEEGEFSRLEPDFEVVRNRKKFSGLKSSARTSNRGNGLKLN